MTFHGIIRFDDNNLSFALPVFKDGDNLYIQDSSGGKDTIERFVKLGNIKDVNKDAFEEETETKKRIDRKEGENLLYVFITHNGEKVVGSKSEIADSLDSCYRQVFFLIFELMNFLDKKEKSDVIKKYLFSEYMNRKEMDAIENLHESNKINRDAYEGPGGVGMTMPDSFPFGPGIINVIQALGTERKVVYGKFEEDKYEGRFDSFTFISNGERITKIHRLGIDTKNIALRKTSGEVRIKDKPGEFYAAY